LTHTARTLAGLAAVTAIAMPAQAAPPAGVYSNVCMSRETGDQGGVELQLTYRAGEPVIVFKTCEGGCWAQPTRVAKAAKDSVTFVATNQSFEANGALAESQDHHFKVRFSGPTATLESPDYAGYASVRLRRQSFKASPSTDPKDWPTPIRRC
jgi:hypothetical protein